ncbi:MAG TPA: hypothetical protein VHY91_23355 [Pirellulales bacterium]|nr:hypothetical protein [Pirellulales bacterium]
MREGWHDGAYDRTSEQTFREIAIQTKRSISTLNNQYCRAFQLIVGHAYSRELWFQLFGPIKLSELIGAGMARTRRPAASATSRPVPDSVVSPRDVEDVAPGAATLVRGKPSADDAGYHQLLDDIGTMIENGRSDEQISEELELPLEAITYIRNRGDMSSLRS